MVSVSEDRQNMSNIKPRNDNIVSMYASMVGNYTLNENVPISTRYDRIRFFKAPAYFKALIP